MLSHLFVISVVSAIISLIIMASNKHSSDSAECNGVKKKHVMLTIKQTA